MTDLLPLVEIKAVEVFTPEGLDAMLEKIRAHTSSLVPDASTEKGRKEIASLAYKVARSKTALDDAGQELVAEWKKKSTDIDAMRRKARDYLDNLRDEIRKPLNEWEAEQARIAREAAEAEAAEAARVEAERLAELKRREDELAAREAAIRAKEDEERERQEVIAADRAMAELAARIEVEAKERADRLAKEAVEEANARAAAAEQARIDDARRAQEERDQAVRDAELRAAQEAADLERKRQEDARLAKAEQDRIEAEAKRRADNVRHQGNVNRTAAAALIREGLSEEDARKAITAIAKGRIPAVTVDYR